MNGRSLLQFGLVCSFLVLAWASHGQAAKKNRDSAPSSPSIREEMGGLFATVSELLPLVLDKGQFEDPKNKKTIARHMNELSRLTRNMSRSATKFGDHDPSIKYLSDRFAEDISYAIEAWNRGDKAIPRQLLKHATDYCITCHTRTSKGQHFNDLIQSQAFTRLPSLTKAEYLAATRQYTDALKQYERTLIDRPLAKLDPESYEVAVRRMLALTVRVENNPALTFEMISRIQDKHETMAESMRGVIGEWRRATKNWVEEKGMKPQSEKDRVAAAKRLIEEADAWESKMARSGLIQLLRASSILHDQLGISKKKENQQELLYLAARAADSLHEVNLWTMQDVYYEECIRTKGPTATRERAEKCYAGLEASTKDAYQAKLVTDLPEFLQVRLRDLKKAMAN